MKAKVYLSVLFFIFCSESIAQPTYNMLPEFLKLNNVWVFGSKAGVDFSSGFPVPIESEFWALEGAAAVAHPTSGKLMFYSNGGTSWNARHRPMPNGSGLLGNGNNGCSNCLSTRQGVCIVPVIGTPGSYYIFSLMGLTNWPQTYANGSLFYSVVDMNLDNGSGAIVQGEKNIVLSSDSLSECMIAIPGERCDIWLLMHEMENHMFRAYHITAGGVNPNPVISYVPSSITGAESFTMSGLAVSPDRRKIALTSQAPGTASGILLAEFDPVTGIVSNGFNVMHTDQYGTFYPGSVDFSPNSSVLYASIFDVLPSRGNVIYQFDVSRYDSAAIANSALAVDTLARSAVTGSPIIFKLYNNKMYLTDFNQANSSLHCINNPDVMGQGYNLDRNILKFLPGTFATLSLGNPVVAAPVIEGIQEISRDISICTGQSVTLQPSRAGSAYTWDDRSTNPSRTVAGPGTYRVTYYQSGCDVTKETFTVQESGLDPQISVDRLVLSTVLPYTGYQWLLNENRIPGATARSYEVKANGLYHVIVYDNGCLDTSQGYLINNVSVPAVSGNADISIYPNPASDIVYINSPVPVHATLSYLDGRVAVRSNGDEAFIMTQGLSKGIYLLRVVNAEGKLLKVEKVVKD